MHPAVQVVVEAKLRLTKTEIQPAEDNLSDFEVQMDRTGKDNQTCQSLHSEEDTAKVQAHVREHISDDRVADDISLQAEETLSRLGLGSFQLLAPECKLPSHMRYGQCVAQLQVLRRDAVDAARAAVDACEATVSGAQDCCGCLQSCCEQACCVPYGFL
eukprot:jgi/Ulvmu1/7559/UM037_0103.1